MDLEKRDFDLRLTPVAVELELQGIDTSAIDHHQVGGSAVADIAAAALCLHKHVVPGRLAQRVDRIVRHVNKRGTFSLPVKTICGIFSA
ncbi:hypothetical protein [Mesorhizobium sp. LSJC264A00]|uniref:hypothetical protein n=1 Tax=unclassified Mesorhizobium TaxID=325217 RepID=UPI0018DC42EE|nr:hypothetical protein [Mesorhizobium sp. LSJC264A00]